MMLTALALLAAMGMGEPPMLDLNLLQGFPVPGSERKPLWAVSIRPDGRILCDGKACSAEQAAAYLKARQGGTEDRVFIFAHKDAPYGVLYHLMETLKQAGFRKIGLVDDYPEPVLP